MGFCATQWAASWTQALFDGSYRDVFWWCDMHGGVCLPWWAAILNGSRLQLAFVFQELEKLLEHYRAFCKVFETRRGAACCLAWATNSDDATHTVECACGAKAALMSRALLRARVGSHCWTWFLHVITWNNRVRNCNICPLLTQYDLRSSLLPWNTSLSMCVWPNN